MSQVDAFIAWFSSHRAHFGGFCASLGAILVGAAQYYPNHNLEGVGAITILVGTHLGATGVFKSDEYHREKRELLKTKIDRRSPDSLIPARDLQKLVATDPKARKADQ